MKYKIDWAEKKAWQDKTYLVTTLTGEDGSKHDKVSIWPDFAGFEGLAPGRDVEGTIATNDKGYKSLKGPQAPARNSGGARAFQMERVMEIKNAGIRASMDTKEQGIKISGAMRDATLILTSLYPEEIKALAPADRGERIRALHQDWVTWLMGQFDDHKNGEETVY